MNIEELYTSGYDTSVHVLFINRTKCKHDHVTFTCICLCKHTFKHQQ